MCNHKNIKPIVEQEQEDDGEKVVFATVCIDCLKEFVISPMLYSDYLKLNS